MSHFRHRIEIGRKAPGILVRVDVVIVVVAVVVAHGLI